MTGFGRKENSGRHSAMFVIAFIVMIANCIVGTLAFAEQTAQSSTAVKAQASPQKRKPGCNEFMWKASSNSGATLYLLGTIHVFKSEYYPLPDEMEKAFAKSKGLLVEINTTKSDPAVLRSLLAQKGIYAPSDDLSKHIDPQTAKQLQKYCSRGPLKFENMLRFKPWMVCLQIVELEMGRLGYSPKDGIDLHLMNEANSTGKRIIGLETEEFQLGLLAGFSPELQSEWLRQSLMDLDTTEKDAKDLMNAWKNGDGQAMDDLMTKDLKDHPEFTPVQEKLIYERNESMAQKLEAYLAGTDTYMCAVGSAHLVGPRGIVELLKKKGYFIKQVKAADSI